MTPRLPPPSLTSVSICVPCSVCRGAPCPQARDCDAGQVCAPRTQPPCSPHAGPSSTSGPGSSELSHHASHRPTCPPGAPPTPTPGHLALPGTHMRLWAPGWAEGGIPPHSRWAPCFPYHLPVSLRACVSAPCGGRLGRDGAVSLSPLGYVGRAVDACASARGAEGLREPRFPWLLENTHLAPAASTLLSGDRWLGAVWG